MSYEFGVKGALPIDKETSTVCFICMGDFRLTGVSLSLFVCVYFVRTKWVTYRFF